MSKDRLGVALLGCGNIAGPYSKDFPSHSHMQLVGAYDIIPDRTNTLAEKSSCRAYPSFEAMLHDPAVDIMVNLTPQQTHYQTTHAALEAGKHVYSEKPLAMQHAEAQELVDLAQGRGLRLSCSPFTLAGEAQQTAWKWIREGRLGRVRLVYAEVNHGRIETWHPSPLPFYAAGPLYDVGVYPLAILLGIFGPARQVTAFATTLLPQRQTRAGETFPVPAPDLTVAMLQFGGENNPLVRLTTNFYVSEESMQDGIEFHGDVGSLFLKSWFSPTSELSYAPFNEKYTPVDLVRPAAVDFHWAGGVGELAAAIQAGRPHRNSAAQAAHMVEILNAAQRSAETGQPVEIRSTFDPPAPMEWAN